MQKLRTMLTSNWFKLTYLAKMSIHFVNCLTNYKGLTLELELIPRQYIKYTNLSNHIFRHGAPCAEVNHCVRFVKNKAHRFKHALSLYSGYTDYILFR